MAHAAAEVLKQWPQDPKGPLELHNLLSLSLLRRGGHFLPPIMAPRMAPTQETGPKRAKNLDQNMPEKSTSVPPGFFAGNLRVKDATSETANTQVYIRLSEVAALLPIRFGTLVVLNSDRTIELEGQGVDELLWAIECADREAIELPARASVDAVAKAERAKRAAFSSKHAVKGKGAK